jgi:hypothetical protein
MICLFLKKNMTSAGKQGVKRSKTRGRRRTGARIIQLIHLVEFRDFVNVNEIKGGEVFALLCDSVEDFVLFHAGLVPVPAKADDDDAVVFGHDCLVDVPARGKVREEI